MIQTPGPHHYHFITKWRVRGDIDLAYDLLNDLLHYTNWWRNVPLRIEEIKSADAKGLNQIVRFEMRTPLFYTLRWELRGIESNKPYRLVSEASGDLWGRGIWTFQKSGDLIDIMFDWEVSLEKRWLRIFSSILRPVFVWSHDLVMKKWEESFRSELKKRMGD